MKTMKKPGTTRAVLVVILVAIFALSIFQSMKYGKEPGSLTMLIISLLIIAILLIEYVIAKRIYPSDKERKREDINEKAEEYIRGED